ncbi:MAG: ferric iron uptake transcriptional regulator [Gammaproteobacteria bacterium]|nr:ferric iron uptake transcriptional regulator [Gammaproteobacteria bacterium]
MEDQDLRRAGLKVTFSRMKILELLENSEKRHMSAEDIYKALLDVGKEIGLATIYRVLTQFEAAGLVIRHHFESGQAVFELERGSHHDHLICVKCGKIVEFVDESIETKQEQIAEENGFKISDHSLIIYGVCSNENCQQ